MAQPEQRPVAYILLDDVDGQKEVKRGFGGSRSEIVTFLRGDLVEREPSQKQPSESGWITVWSCNSKGHYAIVPKEVLGPLTTTQFHLLITVAHASDRFSAYQNKHLQEAERYAVHSKVIVALPNYPELTPGVVWYAGPVEALNGGTMFGVELLADPPRGNCDGSFQEVRYFACSKDCGIFVGFDLRL
jgi:hypothetical protein